jgi:predicted permease
MPLAQDLRYAVRLARRSPGFAIVTLVTLALGIGMNTAIFTLLDAILFRSLDVPHPEQLAQVLPIYRNGNSVPLSYALFDQLQRNQRVFSALFGWTSDAVADLELSGNLSVTSVRGVTGNFYEQLGATPQLGRLIGPSDELAIPAANVAVVGYECWQSRFGGDPHIVGKVVHINGDPFTIVGVSRRWFVGMTPGAPPEFTIPFTAGARAKNAGMRYLLYIFAAGRLQNGVSLQQGEQQLRSFWHDALVATAPTDVPGQRLQSWLKMGLELHSAEKGINRELRSRFVRPLEVLMWLVTLILLVACMNLATLALSRAAARHTEMSVRVALGASRARIVKQLLAEQLLLCAAGAALALFIGYLASRLLISYIAGGEAVPYVLDLRPDWRVFGFVAAVAFATTVINAVAPVWKSWQHAPASILGGARTVAGGIGQIGRMLIIAQTAGSLVLLFGAGLLLRTFQNLRTTDPGFVRHGVLQIALQPRPEQPSNDAEMDLRLGAMLAAIRNLPGVSAVSLGTIDVPAGDTLWTDSLSLSVSDTSADVHASLVAVSSDWFHTLGIPITSGRSFEPTDDAKHPPVAILDGNSANRLRASGSILGSQIRFGVQPAYQHMQVVGIAHNARLIDLRDPNRLVFFVPLAQSPARFDLNLFVRSKTPAATERSVEAIVQSFGHEFVSGSKTLEQSTAASMNDERVTALLAGVFGVMALFLVAIGLFGLMSYTVRRRTREIGIRMALGSQRTDVLRLIVRESILLTLAGIAVGVPCTLAAARLIKRMLFGVGSFDPVTFGVAAAGLLAVGIAASCWPARRAMNTDPVVALKSE